MKALANLWQDRDGFVVPRILDRIECRKYVYLNRGTTVPGKKFEYTPAALFYSKLYHWFRA
jgi:hypothetical protein